ncbi:hypothetical protein [Scytonema millei]|uniref:Uncharacterized protein n=1 Tax=Scytonema millei VB511283 TaxID=1245923 RepID=A0A9X5I409_9CYAN|nr:hypothetical protein [Scytonema millei]NHC35053.1 hypothetical protein [Scytonema millei VB511283]
MRERGRWGEESRAEEAEGQRSRGEDPKFKILHTPHPHQHAPRTTLLSLTPRSSLMHRFFQSEAELNRMMSRVRFC